MRRSHIHAEAGVAVPLLLALLGGALAAGLVIGAILGLAGGLDLVGEPARIASAATASYYDCPNGESLGEVARGDRVFITARDDSGQWVQVRSPNAVTRRAWMRAIHVLADGTLDGLPVLSCKVPVEALIVTTSTTTSSTTVPETTTSSTTTSTTTTSSTTTTTTVAPPSVGAITASEDPIWEENIEGLGCNTVPEQVTTSLIAAVAAAPAGTQSVTMHWSVGGEFGSVPMSLSGGQYRATLGPFDAKDSDVVPTGQSLPITVTVEVLDTLQRPATGQITVTLNDCSFG